jgi:hypothetical protein
LGLGPSLNQSQGSGAARQPWAVCRDRSAVKALEAPNLI